jgi:hypothetical protein
MKKFNVTVLHEVWAAARTLAIVEIPDYYQIPISALAAIKSNLGEHINNAVGDMNGRCLVVPHDSTTFKQDYITKIREQVVSAGLRLIDAEPFPDPLVTLDSIRGCDCVLGFNSPYLQLASMMTPGSTVIEIQKPDSVSRAVLLAAGLGMKVHVFVEKDGEIDIEAMKKLVAAIPKSKTPS